MDPITQGFFLNTILPSANAAEGSPTEALPEHPQKLSPSLLSNSAEQLVKMLSINKHTEVRIQAQSVMLAFKDDKMLLSSTSPEGAIYRTDFVFPDGISASVSITVKLNLASRYDITGFGLSIPLREVNIYTPVTVSDAKSMQAGQHIKISDAAAAAKINLLSLPPELLLQIVTESGKGSNRYTEHFSQQHNYNGINMSMRSINKYLQAIADVKMSPAQRFIVNNRNTFDNLGIVRGQARQLSHLPENAQRFVLEQFHILVKAGFSYEKIYYLASRSSHAQRFVLDHVHFFKNLGFDPDEMIRVGLSSDVEQRFILIHGRFLQETGFSLQRMIELSILPENKQRFVFEHSHTLLDLGLDHNQLMQLIRGGNEDQCSFLVIHSGALKRLNIAPTNLLQVAFSPSFRHGFLQAYGHLLQFE